MRPLRQAAIQADRMLAAGRHHPRDESATRDSISTSMLARRQARPSDDTEPEKGNTTDALLPG